MINVMRDSCSNPAKCSKKARAFSQKINDKLAYLPITDPTDLKYIHSYRSKLYKAKSKESIMKKNPLDKGGEKISATVMVQAVEPVTEAVMINLVADCKIQLCNNKKYQAANIVLENYPNHPLARTIEREEIQRFSAFLIDNKIKSQKTLEIAQRTYVIPNTTEDGIPTTLYVSRNEPSITQDDVAQYDTIAPQTPKSIIASQFIDNAKKSQENIFYPGEVVDNFVKWVFEDDEKPSQTEEGVLAFFRNKEKAKQRELKQGDDVIGKVSSPILDFVVPPAKADFGDVWGEITSGVKNVANQVGSDISGATSGFGDSLSVSGIYKTVEFGGVSAASQSNTTNPDRRKYLLQQKTRLENQSQTEYTRGSLDKIKRELEQIKTANQSGGESASVLGKMAEVAETIDSLPNSIIDFFANKALDLDGKQTAGFIDVKNMQSSKQPNNSSRNNNNDPKYASKEYDPKEYGKALEKFNNMSGTTPSGSGLNAAENELRENYSEKGKIEKFVNDYNEEKKKLSHSDQKIVDDIVYQNKLRVEAARKRIEKKKRDDNKAFGEVVDSYMKCKSNHSKSCKSEARSVSLEGSYMMKYHGGDKKTRQEIEGILAYIRKTEQVYDRVR